MAGEADDEDELLLNTPLDPEDDDADDRRDDDDSNVNDEDEGEEEVLTFGGDAEEQDGDSGLVKHLRGIVRAKEKELSEVRRMAPREEPIEVGEKPTMAGCEFDEERFENELDAWKERKAKEDARTGQSKEAQEAEREAWQAELNRVDKEKAELGADDIDDAFDTVRASLNTVQQAVLVKATDNTARLIYALAKHPDRLAELAAIQDPLKLAVKIAKLEGQLKVVKKRRVIDPDTPERGSGRISQQPKNKQLEKLEKEADRTGDRTELIKFKSKQAAK